MLPKRNFLIHSFWLILPVILAGVCLALLLGGMRGSSRALAAQQSAPADNIVTIGVQAALTLGNNYIGVRQANAVQLAVDEINTAGGVDIGGTSYTVELVLADSQCRPEQADDAANDLLAAGVVAVVGDTCNSSHFIAQPIFDAAGVSLVSASATSPQITDRGYDTTFRVISRADTWPMRAAEGFYNTYAMRSAAVIEMEGFDGSASTDVFTDTFGVILGGTITSVNILSSTDDITATLTKIQGEGAQVIYFPWNDSAVAGEIAFAAYNLGMEDTPIAWDSMLEAKSTLLPGYDAVAGSAAEMNYAIFYYREPAEMPGYPEFNAAYVAANFTEFGDEAQMWGAFAYDAAKIILAAIDRADSIDPELIRDEIASTPANNGVVGTYEGFDNNGDVIPQWGDMLRTLNGDWLSLHPDPATLPVNTYLTDDFSATTLGDMWSWINENSTHWSLTANPGFLRITLQPTPVTNWLVQPVPTGDFDILTHVVFNPAENFEIAGLLLYQENDTFLLLGRAFCDGAYPNCVEGNGIYFDHVEDTAWIGDNFAMRTPYEDHAYLRIIHEGENYTAYVSEDGADWWLVGRHMMSTGFDLTSMGLATATGAQEVEEIYTDFDFFKVGPYTLPTLKSLLPLVLKLPVSP
jgi:branched-chain amino acid transport system substrate-binding protein